ncbi:hypothetical protein PR048_008868 [Dryococelus australis]|uniref:Uncharacterized protein n=1 Tax=Dryococelus australis TaxID=614101 RepID=A0ABQ9HYC8_9NEOP|nr:hypothetical protein PR048_008868 [Dryococelus australis]
MPFSEVIDRLRHPLFRFILYRYSAKGFPSCPSCHQSTNSAYKCSELTMQDVRSCHRMFYATQHKVRQDGIILSSDLQTNVSISVQKGKRRVEEVCKRNFSTGKPPEENREGDVRGSKYVDKKTAARAFIEKLRPVQSHYNRGKNTTK